MPKCTAGLRLSSQFTEASPALEKLRAGANLLQVYTGLVYRGPSLLHAINSGLVQMLGQRGARSLAELAAG